jgi:2-phosphosulfolactate phosphatase
LQVTTVPTWQSAPEETFEGASAVVFDVLRATTTIAYALAAGARAVLPVDGPDAARRLRAAHPDWILGGEVAFRAPPDFDLGNSPTQYTKAAVADRTVLLATTNGTRALVAARGAARVYAAGLVNARATAEALPPELPVVLVASGTVGMPSLEDLLGAGAVLAHLMLLHDEVAGDTLSRIALETFQATRAHLPDVLYGSENGRRLVEAGFGDDVAAAARLDGVPVVVELQAGEPLTLAKSDPGGFRAPI